MDEIRSNKGAKLFNTFVDDYAKRGNTVGYKLLNASNYFEPECLAFAAAFTRQVEQMPPGAEVDSVRLMASFYLLNEARQKGLIET